MVLARRFDPDEAWRAIERHRVNLMLVIGDAMARPLIEAYRAGGYDASSLLSLSSSAALFSPAVKEACAAALPHVVITESIGSTETGFTGLSMFSAGTAHRGGPDRDAGTRHHRAGRRGPPAGPGQVGRIARGGHVPLGYYRDPVQTAAMFAEVDGGATRCPATTRGSSRTAGDAARPRQHLREHRRREGLPRGGRGRAQAHPDVFDALVIGVPDERLGQRVAALVQVRDGRPADLAAIEAHLRGLIAGYKLPRSIWLVDAIGRTRGRQG